MGFPTLVGHAGPDWHPVDRWTDLRGEVSGASESAGYHLLAASCHAIRARHCRCTDRWRCARGRTRRAGWFVARTRMGHSMGCRLVDARCPWACPHQVRGGGVVAARSTVAQQSHASPSERNRRAGICGSIPRPDGRDGACVGSAGQPWAQRTPFLDLCCACSVRCRCTGARTWPHP